ncbi:MAG: 5-formyltetrahydrofolate cyclo-ligase [Halofilum sp. (in: g-proteobacteria)]|nr:5-formyltetrahydrofolate cyclo-ligase [Halofilum sp. (in: g-proteobacteria)]
MEQNSFDWQAWRREVRRDRITAREALSHEERQPRNEEIDRLLEAGFEALGQGAVAFCWPFRNEPEPRFAVRRWREAGAEAALPVVVAPRTPMIFRQWWPGVATAPGVYEIPYPVDSLEVTPTAAIVPLVGFDAEGYRLGYGGGYFDRTLAAMRTKPVTIGLAYELARLRTIHAQPHDIPMDFIVTERGIFARIDGQLQQLDPADADAHVRELQRERSLV